MRNAKLRVVAVLVVLAVVLHATSSLAFQGRGKGGGNSQPVCSEDAFPATMQFGAHPSGLGPAILPSDGGPVLHATVNYGNLASRTENDNMEFFPLPMLLSFPTGSGYPAPALGPIDVAIDPHVSSRVWDQNLDAVACQMFGMEVGATPYRMRLTIQWHEKYDADGVLVPVPWEERKTDQRWVLRYRPNRPDLGPVTWLDVVRTARGEWVATTRDDSSPVHFADLEKTGQKKDPTVHTTPSMPFQLIITVDCDLGGGEECPLPPAGQ